MSVPQMRAIIRNVYYTNSWRAKVDAMPPKQVCAVYLSFQRRGLIK